MTDEFDKAVAEVWDQELKRPRKYASFFHFSDKKLKERGVVATLMEAMEQGGVTPYKPPVVSVDEKQQWPDCTVKDEQNRDVAVEVTELVSQEAIEASQHDDHKWCWWSDAGVINRLDKILSEKDRSSFHGHNYAKVVLVIHTDEPAVDAEGIGSLVNAHIFPKPKNIDEVYLLMSYQPLLGGGYYPYFRLTLSS